jgi:hypothetical protein
MLPRTSDATPRLVQTRAKVALFLLALALGCDFRFRCSGAAPAEPPSAESTAAGADASGPTSSGTLPNRAAAP